MNAVANPYQVQSVVTAGPAQLVLMLFDGALGEVARATVALEAPVNVEEANDCLGRAQAIVTELSVTLDHERGGEVANNLARLYAFCQERLIEANLRKTAAGLDAVTDTIQGLRDAWQQACVIGAVAVAVPTR